MCKSLILGLMSSSLTGGLGILLVGGIFFLDKRGSKIPYEKYIWILLAVSMFFPFAGCYLPYTYIMEVPDYMIKRAWGEISLAAILIICWFVFGVALAVYYSIGYQKMYRKMMRWSRESQEKSIKKIISETASELGMKRLPEVRIMEKEIQGPFTIGLRKNIIFLQREEMSDKDLCYILKHEMVHCQKKDIWLALFFIGIGCFYWFHPLVWMMRALVKQNMEISCDAIVIENLSSEERREYCDVIMSCVEQGKSKFYPGTTGYVQNTVFLRKRFSMILEKKGKCIRWKNILSVVCMAIIVLILSGNLAFKMGEKKYLVQKVDINYGIEVHTDINGDGKDERVYVIDNVSGDIAFTQISSKSDDGNTLFKNYPDCWSSHLITGDLTGNGIADVVLMRYAIGSTFGGGEFSVLHMGKNGWEEYPEEFIHNPTLHVEQPENFKQLSCVGVSIVNKNGKCFLRIIAVEDIMEDTVNCIDCSYQEKGWFIEEIHLITDYYGMNRASEFLEIEL